MVKLRYVIAVVFLTFFLGDAVRVGDDSLGSPKDKDILTEKKANATSKSKSSKSKTASSSKTKAKSNATWIEAGEVHCCCKATFKEDAMAKIEGRGIHHGITWSVYSASTCEDMAEWGLLHSCLESMGYIKTVSTPKADERCKEHEGQDVVAMQEQTRGGAVGLVPIYNGQRT